MKKEFKIHLFDLLMSLSNAVDLVSPVVANHHKRVAYIAQSIARQAGFSTAEQHQLVMAAAVHDIGAFSLQERVDSLHFEMENPHRHARLGYLFLKRFDLFSDMATLVRYHHLDWADELGARSEGEAVPMGSHLLHLSDRVDTLIDGKRNILGQVKEIGRKIEGHAGPLFVPELVTAFKNLAAKEYFWLDAASPSIDQILSRQVKLPTVELDLDGLLSLAQLFAHIIDFKSPFTSTHSSGLAASAAALAEFVGLSPTECQQMRIAGYLHDLGKLAIPAEILQKPAPLTEEEFALMRSHALHTRRILESISDLDIINDWASSHHERLDGQGYPFHEGDQDLSLGARIMAVSDVFTALTEERPYQKTMTSHEALQVLQRLADRSALDPKIVSLLSLHFEEVDSRRKEAQEASQQEYQRIMQQCGGIER
jgi:HD-GYP domain-containing protein (c-di-GMP phosphodiesterase class II)